MTDSPELPTESLAEPMTRLVLLTVSEMYRADALAARAGVAGPVLMENAGRGVAQAIFDRWSRCRVLVLCGPGNNGGDGFVAARLLKQAGWPVRVALLGSREALKGDAAGAAATWDGPSELADAGAVGDAELVVDALFGAGLSRDIEGKAAELLAAVEARALPVLAVDVPSGVHGDTGRVMGKALKADMTVTFFRRKPSHLLLPGRFLAGDVRTADIGTPLDVLDEIAPRQWENGPALWRHAFSWPRTDGHKYHRGHAVVVCGPPGMTGASRLAARSALRVGAGLVTISGPPSSLAVNAGHSTAIMTNSFDNTAQLIDFVSDNRRNAVLLGPGNGVTGETRDNVLAVLSLEKATVLDADALSVFADAPAALFEAVRGATVLTPHDGEFRRVFPELADSPDRLAKARSAARDSGAVVVLKGPDTVVAAPDGRGTVNANAPAELATAGTGDVLAGLITGLLAQGMPAFEAACAGVWIHGEAARLFGPGLISEDLPDRLPPVLRKLKQGVVG